MTAYAHIIQNHQDNSSLFRLDTNKRNEFVWREASNLPIYDGWLRPAKTVEAAKQELEALVYNLGDKGSRVTYEVVN